jgi:GntP family gluconate:H+ symporter
MNPVIELLLILGGVIAMIIVFISVLKIHPAVTLGLAAVLTGLLLGLSFQDILVGIYDGFINVILGVGVIIILGAVLGNLMEHSGALNSIIGYVFLIFGKNKPVTSLSVLGLFIGIPVFCDSGFIILSKVANNMADRRGLPRYVTAVGLAGGLYTAHTLIPPTPGPVAAAGNLNFGNELGLVLLSGLLVSIPILAVLILVSSNYGKGKSSNDLDDMTITERPVFSLLLPVVTAILLIATGSVISITAGDSAPEFLSWLFHPITALLVACVIAWIQIGKERKTAWIGKGIKDALPIVLITGMGGAFGQVLKMSTLISNVTDLFASSGGSAAYLLLIGFATALIIKTAQGSSTAAIVISSSLIFPLTGELTAWQTALLMMQINQ